MRGTSATARTSSGRAAGSSPCGRAGGSRRRARRQLLARAQHDEERHPAFLPAAREPTTSASTIASTAAPRGRSPRPHADAAAVDRRVRPPVDDRRPALGDADPVAVAPDRPGTSRIRLAQPGPSGSFQKKRHGRHRPGEASSPTSLDERAAVLVAALPVAAQRARLQLAQVHGERRAAADERGAHVRAALASRTATCPRRPLVDPGEALGASGEPVEPTARSADSRGPPRARPPFMHAARYAALVPKVVTCACAARSQSRRGPGPRVAVVEDDRRAGAAARRRGSSTSSSPSW